MKSNDKSKQRFCFYCGGKLSIITTVDGLDKVKCSKCGVIAVSKRVGRRKVTTDYIEPYN